MLSKDVKGYGKVTIRIILGGGRGHRGERIDRG